MHGPPCIFWATLTPVSLQAPGQTVDLTAVGGTDWVHWGRQTARDVDYMLRRSPEGAPMPASVGATVLVHCLPSQPQRYTDDAFPGARSPGR